MFCKEKIGFLVMREGLKVGLGGRYKKSWKRFRDV